MPAAAAAAKKKSKPNLPRTAHIQHRLEWQPISEIQKAVRNPKKHSIPEIRESIARFGFTEPVLLDERTGRLIAGHGRLETLLQMHAEGILPKGIKQSPKGEWLVPVIHGWASKNDYEANAYLVASNRLVERGGWHTEDLAGLLNELRANIPASLVGIGFDEKELDAMVKQLTPDVGPDPEQRFEAYQEGAIKQIVLYFEGAQYDGIMPRLKRVAQHANVDNNSEAFLAMLERYEETYELATQPLPELTAEEKAGAPAAPADDDGEWAEDV